MTKTAFNIFLNNLVDNYNHEVRDTNDDIPICQFLDDQGVDKEIVKDINPLHLVEEISKCDLYDGITLDYTDSTEYTTKFKILMGLCECVSYVNRPNPVFEFPDIVQGNTATRDVRFVKAFNKEDDGYVTENLEGDTEMFSRNWMESRYHKIGDASAKFRTAVSSLEK
jgi:hypothetical protein